MNKPAISLICLISFLFVSCKTMMDYKMDVLRPGYIKSQADINAVLLIDNAGKQPSGTGHKCYDFGKFVKDTVLVTDSLSPRILSFLSANLSDEGFYETVMVAPDNWLRPAKTDSLDFLRPDGLNNLQKNVLKDSMSTGYWISLDRLIVKTKTVKVRFDADISYAIRDVVVNSVWRVTDARKDTLCLLFQHNDSLYWKRWATRNEDPLKYLPDFKETLPEIADYIASRVYRIFGPFWETINRFYYCSGSYRMTLAVDCINNDDWVAASNLWQDEYEKGFGKSVYRAAMNMMLYYEYLDKPEEALKWNNRAQVAMDKSFPRYSVQDKQILDANIEYIQQRMEELSRLKVKDSDL